MDPVFGWGSECRFSWATAKDLLEPDTYRDLKVHWPAEEDANELRVIDYFTSSAYEEQDELATWFGKRVPAAAF